MSRELKIVISIFLVFLIYGISSFFSLGAFVTPFFLDKFILLGVAVLFAILNYRLKNSYLLFLYIPAMLAFAMRDEFTIGYLSEKYRSDFLIKNFNEPFYLISTIGYFFGFYFVSVFHFYKVTNKRYLSAFLLFLILASVVFTGTEIHYAPDITMGLFLLSFFLIVQWIKKDLPVLETLTSQFLLLFLLTSFEYFL